MRTAPFAALALASTLFSGCSGDVGADVVLLPCPSELFSMVPVGAQFASAELPALEPGPAVPVPAAVATSPQAVLPPAPSPRAEIPASFFDKKDDAAIVAQVESRDKRLTAPTLETGYAAAGAGMATRPPRRPAPPVYRSSKELSSEGGLASSNDDSPRSVMPTTSGRVSLTKAQASPLASLTQEAITKTVHAQMPRIRACYERVIKHDPGARGRLVMSWVIQADGGVDEVRVVADQVGSEQFTGCAERSIAKWRFPKSVEDVAVEGYPFVMTPRNY